MTTTHAAFDDLPPPAVQPANQPRVVAQQDGEVFAEAPLWYNLAINGSFSSIICVLFIWQSVNTPSATQTQKDTTAATMLLLDRSQAGMEKIIDKFDRSQDKLAANISDLKEVFRHRAIVYEKGVTDLQSSMREMTDGARKYHEAAEIRSAKIRALTEEQVELLTKIANAKKM